MKKQFTHIDASGNPQMVDVSEKKITRRMAKAQAVVVPGKEILSQIRNNELITKKGPVFQTAIIAGVMAAKKTHELIPFCHSLAIEDCQVRIEVKKERIVITSETVVTGKTGVEMEALTAASVAALTVYDMCKALSHEIVIEDIKLLEKRGGKKDFSRKK
ncbi:MAG TPA: cyclic pyranopterin monophosphate synthase MoaC [Cyclobacteriaceae bacterium]|jgi:cyclic pyranopterin phosphate synthase|nr:cyclic pyranopterin monophosphate synthase MoaC [Cytophagales bacterium]HMR58793.1 cyclic pyranopterin monophosphate synthase MoaC [Cyclobacteriaceae bacterium]HRE66139.1 cyclic pyranopterin monophosphate synthase MoaC [Cyclobacteriaceae bacterium]HRF32170.1 cyclic pyranopterin monophosphate synthase MoaC [Cyclobacteriaceae bacterium]